MNSGWEHNVVVSAKCPDLGNYSVALCDNVHVVRRCALKWLGTKRHGASNAFSNG